MFLLVTTLALCLMFFPFTFKTKGPYAKYFNNFPKIVLLSIGDKLSKMTLITNV